MLVGEYQRAARTTAIYPSAAGVYYPALGFAGELGELCNKAKKIIRGDVTFDQRNEDFKKELGDVMWYVAALASDAGLELRAIAQDAEIDTQITGDLYSVLLTLQAYAGCIAAVADQARIHGMTEHRRLILRNNLIRVLVGIARLCVILDAELADICMDNIQKLFKRRDTGTIKGDGDNREQYAEKVYRVQACRPNGDWYDTGDKFPDDLAGAVEFAHSEALRHATSGHAFRVIDAGGHVHGHF